MVFDQPKTEKKYDEIPKKKMDSPLEVQVAGGPEHRLILVGEIEYQRITYGIEVGAFGAIR